MSVSVNVLVLNYNGRALLEKYLPALEEAVTRSRFRCRLSVIDNKSSDDSLVYLGRHFPKVDVYPAPQNRVLCSYNDVARALSDDIVILMNNDIRVEPDFVDPLVEPFLAASDVFFVTPRCLSMKDGSYEGNKTRARIRYGIFWASSLYPGHEKEAARPGPTFHGGFGAFDRKKFVEIGGYDDLYLPGRLEDADICFRAAQRAWRSLYEPKSVVYHEGGVSFHKAFGVKKTLVINWRNTFLFMWKNLTDPVTFLKHALWLPLRLAASLLFFKPELFLGFCSAWPMRDQARRRRRALKESGFLGAVPDRAVMARV